MASAHGSSRPPSARGGLTSPLGVADSINEARSASDHDQTFDGVKLSAPSLPSPDGVTAQQYDRYYVHNQVYPNPGARVAFSTFDQDHLAYGVHENKQDKAHTPAFRGTTRLSSERPSKDPGHLEGLGDMHQAHGDHRAMNATRNLGESNSVATRDEAINTAITTAFNSIETRATDDGTAYKGPQKYQPPQVRQRIASGLEDPFTSNIECPRSLSERFAVPPKESPPAPDASARELANYIRTGALSGSDDTYDASSLRPLFRSTPGRGHRNASFTPNRDNASIGSGSPPAEHQETIYNSSTRTPLRSVIQHHTFSISPDPLVQQFIRNGGPTYNEMVSHLPFTASAQFALPSSAGVLRVSDIPFNTHRKELVALFGRQAKLVTRPANSSYFAIHIIMERTTAKSMECYVEFGTSADAASSRIRVMKYTGNRPRVGDRPVAIDVVGQDVLMKALFPKAKYVKWQGCVPSVHHPEQEGVRWASDGFKGFVMSEEMHMTLKFAQDPRRSRYALKHPQRTYESMISLLTKYPWAYTKFYTLGERDLIFKTTEGLIHDLQARIIRGQSSDTLTPMLLEELAISALECPGFSEQQKARVVDTLEHGRVVGPPVMLNPYAKIWPFAALNQLEGVTKELIDYFAALLREATYGPGSAAFPASGSPFGNIGGPLPKECASAAFDQIVLYEFGLLRSALATVARPDATQYIAPSPGLPAINAYGGAPMFGNASYNA